MARARSTLQTDKNWYESNLLWGALGTSIAIVLTVIATMKYDLRWLLIVAWILIIFSGVPLAQSTQKRQKRPLVLLSLAAVSASALLVLSHWLKANQFNVHLSCTLDTVSLRNDGDKTLASIFATVRNPGDPSTAENYRLRLRKLDGQILEGQQIRIPPDGMLIGTYPDGRSEHAKFEDALEERTIHSFEQLANGRLLFKLDSPYHLTHGSVAEYELSFDDILGKTITCTRRPDGSGPTTSREFPGTEPRFRKKP